MSLISRWRGIMPWMLGTIPVIRLAYNALCALVRLLSQATVATSSDADDILMRLIDRFAPQAEVTADSSPQAVLSAGGSHEI